MTSWIRQSPETHAARRSLETVSARVSLPLPKPGQLSWIRARIDVNTPLLTVYGPPGSGKSTLLRLAAGSDVTRPTFWVDLDGAKSEPDMLGRIAAAFDTESTGFPEDITHAEIANRLKGLRAVLVLDNADDVTDYAEALVCVVRTQAPELVSLQGMRHRPIHDEAVTLFVPGLPIPEVGSTLDEMFDSPAVAAFLQYYPREVPAADLPAVASLCRLVSGNPVAIALIAAGCGACALHNVEEDLRRRLTTIDFRDTDDHLDELVAWVALDWAYDRLAPLERLLLRRISVIAHPTAGDDLAGLLGADQAADEPALFSRLVSAQFLKPEGEGLYRLDRIGREFASEYLRAHQEYGEATHQYAQLCLRHLRSPSEPGSLTDDFIRDAVVACFDDGGDAIAGIELMAATVDMGRNLLPMMQYGKLLDARLQDLDQMEESEPRLALRLIIERLCINQHTVNDDLLMQALYNRAFQLAYRIYSYSGDPSDLFAIHQAAASNSFALGDGPETRFYADRMADLARDSGTVSVAEITAPRLRAQAMHFMGDHKAALPLMHKVMNQSEEAIRNRTFIPGERLDPRISVRILYARTLWMTGYPDQASGYVADLMEEVRDSWDHLVCYVASFSAVPIAMWRGDYYTAQLYASDMVERATERKLIYWGDWARRLAEAVAVKTMPIVPLTSHPTDRPNVLLNDLLPTLDERFLTQDAIERVDAGLVGWCAPEILRVGAETRKNRGCRDFKTIETQLVRAHDLAKRQGARGWQLRTAMSLARLSRDFGPVKPSQDRLAAALETFSEGHYDSDYVQAQSLL